METKVMATLSRKTYGKTVDLIIEHGTTQAKRKLAKCSIRFDQVIRVTRYGKDTGNWYAYIRDTAITEEELAFPFVNITGGRNRYVITGKNGVKYTVNDYVGSVIPASVCKTIRGLNGVELLNLDGTPLYYWLSDYNDVTHQWRAGGFITSSIYHLYHDCDRLVNLATYTWSDYESMKAGIQAWQASR
jgi:hypothetical protein